MQTKKPWHAKIGWFLLVMNWALSGGELSDELRPMGISA